MSKLYEQLSSAFANYEYRNADLVLPEILSNLSISDIRKLIESSALDASKDQELLDSSYFHPNGFSKLVLMRCPDTNFILRMHIWNNTRSESVSTKIHTHSRDAWSRIVRGTIEDTTFIEVGDASSRLYKTKIKERDTKSSYVFEQGGKIDVRSVSSKMYVKGDVYSFESDALHSSTVPENCKTITLFLQSPTNREYAYSYTDYERLAPDDLPAFNLEMYKEALTQALDWI